mmetsp:Transcript_51793/g.147628  ORF Transcript_51793/g.147628 Transcript_51793/m.147628 type:complete len:276 (+) Transcript_51793:918-1745(+)
MSLISFFHLGKGVLAVGLCVPKDCGQPGYELGKCSRALLVCQPLHHADDLLALELHQRPLRSRARLERRRAGGQLHQGVGASACPAHGRRDDALRVRERLQLLLAAFHRGLVVGRRLHAGLLHVLQRLRRLLELPGGNREIALEGGLGLLARGLGRPLLLQGLVGVRVLVREGLPHQLVVVLGGRLRAPALAELRLGLVAQVLHHLHDAAAVRAVGLRGWGPRLLVALLGVVPALEQGGQLLPVRSGEPRGLHHGLQPRKDLVESLRLGLRLHER